MVDELTDLDFGMAVESLRNCWDHQFHFLVVFENKLGSLLNTLWYFNLDFYQFEDRTYNFRCT